jgi:hypothetical protein
MRERGCEVLVGNRDLTLFPELADPPHRRRDHPLVEARDTHALAQGLPGHPPGAPGVGNRKCILIST